MAKQIDKMKALRLLSFGAAMVLLFWQDWVTAPYPPLQTHGAHIAQILFLFVVWVLESSTVWDAAALYFTYTIQFLILQTAAVQDCIHLTINILSIYYSAIGDAGTNSSEKTYAIYSHSLALMAWLLISFFDTITTIAIRDGRGIKAQSPGEAEKRTSVLLVALTVLRMGLATATVCKSVWQYAFFCTLDVVSIVVHSFDYRRARRCRSFHLVCEIGNVAGQTVITYFVLYKLEYSEYLAYISVLLTVNALYGGIVSLLHRFESPPPLQDLTKDWEKSSRSGASENDSSLRTTLGASTLRNRYKGDSSHLSMLQIGAVPPHTNLRY